MLLQNTTIVGSSNSPCPSYVATHTFIYIYIYTNFYRTPFSRKNISLETCPSYWKDHILSWFMHVLLAIPSLLAPLNVCKWCSMHDATPIILSTGSVQWLPWHGLIAWHVTSVHWPLSLLSMATNTLIAPPPLGAGGGNERSTVPSYS